MKRFKKSALALLMTLVMVMSSLFVIPADAAEVATEGSGASITFEASGFSWPKSGTVTCYTLSNGRVNTYSDVAATKYTGYISGSTDQCTIIGYNTKYATFQVKYPTSSGTKTAWTKWSNFIYNPSYSSKSETLDKAYTVYTKSNLSKTIGTAYKGDKVSIVSQSGNLLQIVYPVGSNWKMGWIKRTPVTTYNDVFASTKGKGYNVSQGRSSASTSFTKGQYVYVWGYVHDANNNLYKRYGSGTVNMTLSIYKPNGSCAYTYTYKNSDNNWIGTTLNTTGTWKIQCKLSGSISGTNTQTITVKDPTPTYKTYYVTANSGVVLRKGAGTSYSKILTIPYGAAVSVSSISNGWATAKYNGYSGFCSSQYLSSNKPTNKGEQLVNYAKTQVGKKYGDYSGQNFHWRAWCADFVSYCARNTGCSYAIPTNASVDGLRSAIKNAGGKEYSKSLIQQGGFTPKAGDIIIFKSAGQSHVGIVSSYSSGRIYYIDGNNTTNGNGYNSCVHSSSCTISYSGFTCVLRPKY